MIRILQIGAGSMGTRRLRDLSTRPDVKLALFEARQDRREQSAARFPVETFADLNAALAWKPDALVISTPPDQHDRYIALALQRGLHHFCEANIWTFDPRKIRQAELEKNIVCAPSNSLHFLPTVKELKRIVNDELGPLHAYQMCLNTYMPDWHPGEGPEYYARNRNTVAGREMVPFELLYLNEIFGPPREVSGRVILAGSLPRLKEDTWTLQMQLAGGATGQFMVLQACPGVMRRGSCFGDNGQVAFNLLSGEISKELRGKDKRVASFGTIKDQIEPAYREEINTAIDCMLGTRTWPHSYDASALATATLAAAEASAERRMPVTVDVQNQPAQLP